MLASGATGEAPARATTRPRTSVGARPPAHRGTRTRRRRSSRLPTPNSRSRSWSTITSRAWCDARVGSWAVRNLAWDAVQESLLSLWQAAEPPAEARPSLLRTVVHRCLHIRRTLHRRWRHEAQAGQLAAAVVTAHNPARELERDTVRHALRCAVSRLSFAQRRAFVLREMEGLDYRDIACRLGVPIGTVRSRLARARSALRPALDGAGRVG
jgi:RNA polymerase sigma factor (sigma-70 family)